MKFVNEHRTRRWVALAAATAACASTLVVAGATSAVAPPGPDFGRYAGSNRYETAALVYLQEFVGPVGTSLEFTPQGLGFCDVVIASGTDFPDGLAGGAMTDRAVLLTEADALPAETAAALAERVASCAASSADTSAVVVGGVGAVSAEVFEEVETFVDSTERLSGANRYETSLEIASSTCGVTVAVPDGGCSNVIIATGLTAADALAASAYAYDLGVPIILNDGDGLRADVEAFLAANEDLSDAIIVGGESAVAAQVKTDLEINLGLTVTRLEGSNRAATAAAIADAFVPATATDPVGVILVNGGDDSFADALAAGPLGGDYSFPILLVDQCSIPAATLEYLEDHDVSIDEVLVVGGTAAVCDAALAEAQAAATASGADVESATLKVDDITNAVYEYPAGANPGGLSFTGKAGGPAAGLDGNGWTITLYQTGATSFTFASPDPATPADLKSIAISGPVDGTTAEAFAPDFNAAMGATFTASVGTAGLLTGVPGGAPATPGSPATADTTIVVTFGEKVNVTAEPEVYAGPLPGQTTPVLPMVDCDYAMAADMVTYTIYCDDLAVAPTVPNAEIRFLAGDVGVVGGIPNPADTTVKLTNV